MLNQIIWTRCTPHRELKDKGRVNRADGFGVFSMSKDLVDNPPVSSFDFLQNRLALQNGAKEGSACGLFHSYDYTLLNENAYALSYEFARERSTETRKNGQTHRAGTFIKQCLVGKPAGYPFEWFGADVWTAADLSEGSYYLEDSPDQEPEWLTQINDTPSGGYINPDIVRRFVQEGRSECVKAGLWFLINQYSKEENERKVLIIKDTPENVELWIAAMEYGLSPALAQTVTFATNRSRLGNQADKVLFYYTDASGRFYEIGNQRLELRRHPYAMIAGIHPQDQFANVRPLANSNFVMIDGKAKTTTIQPDESINNAYYNALIRYDDDILDFSMAVLSSLPIDNISSQLPSVYDAYMYLLDKRHSSDQWQYTQTVKALQTLFAEGISSDNSICGHLLKSCMMAYSSFAEKDEANGFTLLKIMWKLAVKLKKTDEVTGLLADRIMNGISKLNSDPAAIIHTWQAVQNSGTLPVIRTALPEIFNDSELPELSKALVHSTPIAAETMMEMFTKMLSSEPEGIKAIRKVNEKFNFAASAVIASVSDKNTLRRILTMLSEDPDLVNEMALQVSTYLEKYKPAEVNGWWDTVIDISGGNVISLCEQICSTKNADLEVIENLLANRIIRSKTCDASLLKAFENSKAVLTNKNNTGEKFYGAWINVAKIADIPEMIQKISKADLSKNAQKTLADILDRKILNATDVSDTVYRKVQEFASDSGMVSKAAVLHDFVKNINRRRRADDAIDDAVELSKYKLTMDNTLFTSDLFTAITDAGTRLCNGELHIQLLTMFKMDNTVMTKYVNQYIAEVLEKANRTMPEVLVSLTEACMNTYKVKLYSAESVASIQKAILRIMEKKLPDYYKSSLIDKVDKLDNVDDKVKKKLNEILNRIEKEYGSSSPVENVLKGFSGLFNRKGK